METVYAYLAGIIDVDGYIFIGRANKYRGKDQPASYSYIPTIGISSTSSVVPDLFQKTFPARRREFHPIARSGHRDGQRLVGHCPVTVLPKGAKSRAVSTPL